MSILALCDERPAMVAPEISVAEAIQLMIEQRVGAVAVVDDNRVVAGIFSERDVLTKAALSGRDPATIPVAEMMTRPVVMATELTTAGEALAAMVNNHVRHLPVVDARGRLLGMLSVRHVLQARVDELTRQLDQLEHGSAAGAA